MSTASKKDYRCKIPESGRNSILRSIFGTFCLPLLRGLLPSRSFISLSRANVSLMLLRFQNSPFLAVAGLHPFVTIPHSLDGDTIRNAVVWKLIFHYSLVCFATISGLLKRKHVNQAEELVSDIR